MTTMIVLPTQPRFKIRYENAKGTIKTYTISVLERDGVKINAYSYAKHGNKSGLRSFLDRRVMSAELVT